MSWVYREPYRAPLRPVLAPSKASGGGTAYTASISETWSTYSETVTTKAVYHLPVSETWSTYSESVTGTLYYLYDDFTDSTINTTKWTVINRIGDQANSELQCMEADNISLSGGILNGVTERLGSPHSCGDAYTSPSNMNYASWHIQQRKGAFIYPPGGTAIIEARWKVPGGTGVWPVFWMLGYQWQANQDDTANIPGANWPVGGWCEIDIAEFLNSDRNNVNCVVHFTVSGGSHTFALPFDATTRYMVYRLEWSLNSLVWKVDAEDGNGFQTLRTVTGAGNVPDVPMYVVHSVAVGGAGGAPNDATLPVTSLTDWVRVVAIAGQDPGEPTALLARHIPRISRNVLLRM